MRYPPSQTLAGRIAAMGSPAQFRAHVLSGRLLPSLSNSSERRAWSATSERSQPKAADKVKTDVGGQPIRVCAAQATSPGDLYHSREDESAETLAKDENGKCRRTPNAYILVNKLRRLHRRTKGKGKEQRGYLVRPSEHSEHVADTSAETTIMATQSKRSFAGAEVDPSSSSDSIVSCSLLVSFDMADE